MNYDIIHCGRVWEVISPDGDILFTATEEGDCWTWIDSQPEDDEA